MADDPFTDPAIDTLSSCIDELALKCQDQADKGLYDPTTFEWKEHGLPGLPSDPDDDDIVPDWHPSHSSLTNRQLALAWFYREFGVIGLWTYIYQIATEEKEAELRKGTPNASWDTIIQDYELGLDSRMLYYLSAMHPKLIKALIDGDLPSRMQDDEFRREVGALTPGNVQGVYIIYLALKRRTPPYNEPHDPSADKYVGQNLTLAQLVPIVDDMKRYVTHNGHRGKNDIEFCKIVDSQYSKRIDHDYQIGESRYVKPNGGKQILAWIERLDELILNDAREMLKKNPNDPTCHIPLRRTFPYVGLAAFPSTRASHHHSHQGLESPLYGLFTAVVKMHHGGNFDVTASTYQILRTVRREDVSITEILCTILASGYTSEAGLCANHAGKQVGRAKSDRENLSATYFEDLEASARDIRESIAEYRK